MAISDELNRIIQAKADIKSALEEKGLTIGDSSTLDEYPALIEDMPSGGGGIDTSTVIDLIEGDITSFEIPYGTTKIKECLFKNSSLLTNVNIPDTVKEIGSEAFSNTSVFTINGSRDFNFTGYTKIKNGAFSNAFYKGQKYDTYYNLVIDSSNTIIENNAFNYAGKNIFSNGNHYIGITDAYINCSNIGESAFANNECLVKVIFGNDVSSIPKNCFRTCINLNHLILHSNIQSIGEAAFYENRGMKDMVLLSETPPTLGNSAFLFANNIKIYVKNSVLDTYINAGGNWRNWREKIKPLAAINYDASTYTVTISGRDNLELYVDASLCDSSVYTFTQGATDVSHNIMVKSVDPSLGVLDTVSQEILVEGNAPTYYATAPTFTVEAPTYEYYYDEEGAVNLKLYVDISTGQLEGYQGQYSTSVNCTNYTGNMSANSRTDSIRQQFSRGTYFDDPETGPFTFGFTTEVYYKDENQNLLYTAGPATFSDTVTPEWNIPERQEPIYINIEANEYSDTEWVINLSTDSDGDFVVDMRSQNSEAIPEEIYNDEVIQNNAGRAEIILERPLYGEYGGAGKTYNIDVYTKGTESFTRSNENRKSINVEEQRPDPLAAPTIEITSERNDRFMTITNNDEHADQIYYSIYRDGDYVETNTLFTDQVQVNIGDRIEAYAHDSNNVYPDSEPDSVEVE